MLTVFFYSFVLLGSTILVYFSGKGRTKLDRTVLLSIAFLLVFVPAAIRYDIGTDYLNYLAIYEGTSTTRTLEVYKYREPLFYFVNWILQNIEAHFQWLFVTFSFVFTFVVFKTYSNKHAWLLHFLFFSMLWLYSFNGMRQAVALSWSLLALFYFFDKRYILFFLLTVIGASFHQSALFIAMAGLAALIPLNTYFKIRIAPLVFIGIIVLTFISMSIVLVYIEQILLLIGFTRYAGYFSSDTHFIIRDFGSGFGVLTKVLFSVYIILNSKAFVSINKNYWLVIILTFAYAVSLVLASKIIIFARMVDTFAIAPIISAYLLVELQRNKQIHRLVLMVFLLFLLLSFIKSSQGNITTYSNPKMNPYQTVFELK